MEPKEHGGQVEMICQQSEVERRAQRPEVELGDPHTKTELETRKLKVDLSIWTELPKRSRGTAESWAPPRLVD